jgi:hypothetical protein
MLPWSSGSNFKSVSSNAKLTAAHSVILALFERKFGYSFPVTNY